jgi:hypothetical protein
MVTVTKYFSSLNQAHLIDNKINRFKENSVSQYLYFRMSITIKSVLHIYLVGEGIVCLKEKRARNTLEERGIGKDFLNRNPVAQQQRERMDKWEYIQLKIFCIKKEMVSKLK